VHHFVCPRKKQSDGPKMAAAKKRILWESGTHTRNTLRATRAHTLRRIQQSLE
jgi:hypothetical protein